MKSASRFIAPASPGYQCSVKPFAQFGLGGSSDQSESVSLFGQAAGEVMRVGAGIGSGGSPELSSAFQKGV